MKESDLDPDELVCLQCGCDVWVEDNGVSHHWDSGNGDIDRDLDADHVAIPDAGDDDISTIFEMTRKSKGTNS